MKKNHFFIPYYGNKRQEVEKIYNEIKTDIENDKYKIIVEPFCGTSALSYYIWTNNKNRNLSFVLNDNNKFLVDLYNISKSPEKFNILYNSIIKIQEATTNKEEYNKVVLKAKEGDLPSWLFVHKVYNIRPMLYPQTRNFTIDSWNVFLNAPIIDFIRNANIIVSNKDALEVYNEYKGNKKAFIFLDPPYLMSDNSWYKDPTVNVYEYLFDNDIKKEKALIVLCLENNWIIKLLFKGKKSLTYDKQYETTKKKTTHIIILNSK